MAQYRHRICMTVTSIETDEEAPQFEIARALEEFGAHVRNRLEAEEPLHASGAWYATNSLKVNWRFERLPLE